MQYVKTYQHPLHYVNSVRCIVRSALRELRPKPVVKPVVPVLSKTSAYYFVFETQPREADDAMLWGLMAFDGDGSILFSCNGKFPVSLWRFRRQGIARTATMMQGIITAQFQRRNIPLHRDEPFVRDGDGVYRCAINWVKYNDLLRLYAS